MDDIGLYDCPHARVLSGQDGPHRIVGLAFLSRLHQECMGLGFS